MKKLLTLIMVAMFALVYANVVTAQTDEELVQIRIGHFAPGAPNVDVYVGGAPTDLQNVPFGTVSDWYQLPAGVYTFAIVPAGASLSEAVIEETVELEAGNWYSAFAIGLAALDSLALDLIEEDYSPLGFGETRLSFYHAIPEFLPVSVVADGETLAFLAYPDTVVSAEGVSEPNFTTLTLTEGTREIQVLDGVDGETVLLDLGEFNYAQQRHYFIAVINIATSPVPVLVSTNLGTIEDEFVGDLRDLGPAASATSGFVRVAHLSSGTPAVDVYLNGELTDIQELAFTELTEFVELPVGTYDVAVAPAGAGLSNAVIEAELVVGGLQYLTAVAHGYIEQDTLELTVIAEDFSEPERGLFRFSVFHAIPSTTPIAVIRDDGLQVISFLAYPGVDGTQPFDFAELVVGAYGFTVVDATNPSVVIAEIPSIQYGAGRNYFIGIIPTTVGYTFDYVEIP